MRSIESIGEPHESQHTAIGLLLFTLASSARSLPPLIEIATKGDQNDRTYSCTMQHCQQKEELNWTYSERRRTIEGCESCERGKNGGEENTMKKKNGYDR